MSQGRDCDMGIMDELYKETSERLFLANRIIGRVKGLLAFPMMRDEAKVIEELKKIIDEGMKEYDELWDKQQKKAEVSND